MQSSVLSAASGRSPTLQLCPSSQDRGVYVGRRVAVLNCRPKPVAELLVLGKLKCERAGTHSVCLCSLFLAPSGHAFLLRFRSVLIGRVTAPRGKTLPLSPSHSCGLSGGRARVSRRNGAYSFAATNLFLRERTTAPKRNKSSFRPPGVRANRNSRRPIRTAEEKRINTTCPSRNRRRKPAPPKR